MADVSVGLDDDGGLDEVVITGDIRQFHIERMDEGAWWMAVYMEDGTEHHINLATKRNAVIHGIYEKE